VCPEHYKDDIGKQMKVSLYIIIFNIANTIIDKNERLDLWISDDLGEL
jgi:hypothetical protein